MKASDLHLDELFELQPDHGVIELNHQRRMLIWDADSFGHLRRELIANLGMVQARPFLRRFGFSNGYRVALQAGEMFQWDDDSEWWLSCPALQRWEGKVEAQTERLVIDREHGVFDMEAIWRRSYEADQHLRVFGPTDEPVCWTLAGFASGFASAILGELCMVRETECIAAGADHCRVVGKTRRAFGEVAEAEAAEYTWSESGPAENERNGKSILAVEGEVLPMADIERRYVLEVLERFHGNRTRTARALGIGANTLWRKLKSWGVPPARGSG